MKSRLIIVAALVALLVGGLGAAGSGESGAVVNKIYPARGFTELSISSAFTCTVRQGSSFSVRIKARESLFSRIEVRQDGEHLRIGLRSLSMVFNGSDSPHVEVIMPSLKALNLSGASSGSLYFDDRQTERCSIDLSGASRLDLSLACKNLSVEASGGSRLSGKVLAGEARIGLSGASALQFDCEFKDLRIDASGASSLTLQGKAPRVRAQLSGASGLLARELEADEAELDASGASRIELAVRSSLSAMANGASRISYSGSPKVIRQDSNGASNITRLD